MSSFGDWDVWMLTLVIFIPSIFAVALLLFPKGTQEWMRWFALLGSAVTLIISLVIFVDYYHLLDQGGTRPATAASLEKRAEAADHERAGPDRRSDSRDYVV